MILVFGKTGQVARELCAFNNILALDRSQADLSNPETCVQAIYMHKPKAVINAAAYTSVDKAEDEEHIATQINCKAPSEIARACADLNIPFVHLSTDYVFCGTGKEAFKTNDMTNPQNAYGRSKALGEKAIMASGANYVILRTSWVFSSHGNNFVKTMLSLSDKHKILNIVEDQIGGPTPARDVAIACIEITKQILDDPKKAGIYHISGTPDVSWCDFAKVIFNKSGRELIVNPVQTLEYPTLAARPLNSRLDCRNTEFFFNIVRPNWCEGLKNILRDLEIKNEKT
jgi:dTDP-4-dehydrorhamnose reductase